MPSLSTVPLLGVLWRDLACFVFADSTSPSRTSGYIGRHCGSVNHGSEMVQLSVMYKCRCLVVLLSPFANFYGLRGLQLLRLMQAEALLPLRQVASYHSVCTEQ